MTTMQNFRFLVLLLLHPPPTPSSSSFILLLLREFTGTDYRYFVPNSVFSKKSYRFVPIFAIFADLYRFSPFSPFPAPNWARFFAFFKISPFFAPNWARFLAFFKMYRLLKVLEWKPCCGEGGPHFPSGEGGPHQFFKTWKEPQC